MNLYAIFGMHRSGHHGVLNWICEQHGDVTHLNNVRLTDNKLGFQMPRPDVGLTKYGDGHDTLINLESFRLPRWYSEGWPDAPAVADNDKVYPVLVIRRFRNWLASMAMHPGSKILKTESNEFVNDWAQRRLLPYANHLEEAMERITFPGLIVIRFDQWFADPEYREELCAQLDIPFTDAGLNVVPRFADGSTFDLRNFDGKAQEMRVLERWQHAQGTEPYERLLKKFMWIDAQSEDYFQANLRAHITPR
jgi:hypothetical protein